MNNVMSLVFGERPRVRWHSKVLVCESRGCMAESLKPIYVGRVVSRKRVLCHGAKGDGKTPAIQLRVTETYGSATVGEVKTELADRLRKLKDGTIVVIN